MTVPDNDFDEFDAGLAVVEATVGAGLVVVDATLGAGLAVVPLIVDAVAAGATPDRAAPCFGNLEDGLLCDDGAGIPDLVCDCCCCRLDAPVTGM